jgi:hypothetical protein
VGYSINPPYIILIVPGSLDKESCQYMLAEPECNSMLWMFWFLAQPGANLFIILAERWRRQRVAGRRARERDWVTNQWDSVISRANLDDGIKPNFAGKRDAPFDRIDWATRHTSSAQPAKPLVGRSGA